MKILKKSAVMIISLAMTFPNITPTIYALESNSSVQTKEVQQENSSKNEKTATKNKQLVKEGMLTNPIKTLTTRVVATAVNTKLTEIEQNNPELNSMTRYLGNKHNRITNEILEIVKQTNQEITDINESLHNMDERINDKLNVIQESEMKDHYLEAKKTIDDLYSKTYGTVEIDNTTTEVSAKNAYKYYEILVNNYNESVKNYKTAEEIPAKEQKEIDEQYEKDLKNFQIISEKIPYLDIINNMSDECCKSEGYMDKANQYYRTIYDFEHQTYNDQVDAYDHVANLQTMIFTSYEEYEESLVAEDKQKETNVVDKRNSFIQLMNDQVVDCGFEKLQTIDKVTGEDNPPECVNTTVDIGLKEYNAYKVYENTKTATPTRGQCYLILKQPIDISNYIQYLNLKSGTHSSYTYVYDIYTKHYILNKNYNELTTVENGKYSLPKSVGNLSFLKNLNGDTDLYDYLTSTIKLDIDKGNDNGYTILLDNRENKNESAVSRSNDCTYYFNQQYINGKNFNAIDKNIITASSEDLYNKKNSLYNNSYLIYVQNPCSEESDYVYTVTNGQKEENSSIFLTDNQTLDLTQFKQNQNPQCDLKNFTVYVSGNVTVKSNSQYDFKGIQFKILGDKSTLNVDNLNITSYGKNSAIEVSGKNATLVLNNQNNFKTNNSNGPDFNEDYKTNYNQTSAVYIKDGGSLTIKGSKGTFVGSNGGCGIRVDKNSTLNIDSTQIVARGSSSSDNVGCAIGGCKGKNEVKYVTTMAKDISVYKEVESEVGKIIINNSTITAESANNNAEDIGCVSSSKSVENGSSISNSTLNLKHGSINKGFKKDNIQTDNELYEISTSSYYNDGTTDKEILVQITGTKGTTDWINFGKIKELDDANKTGTATATGKNIGKPTSIKLKVNGDNAWYPNTVKITGTSLGESETFNVYRWITTNEVNINNTDKAYEVALKTANVSHAGTDATVKVKLNGSKNEQKDFLDVGSLSQNRNAFESGETDTVKIGTSEDLGNIEGVYIYTNHKNPGADWLIESIKVTDLVNQDNTFTIHPKKEQDSSVKGAWLDDDMTAYFGRYTTKTGCFNFDLKTKDKRNAGTDNTVKIQINGTKGSTKMADFNSYIKNHSNAYEKGNHDYGVYTYDTKELGKITGVKIQKSGSNDWDPEYIILTEATADGETYARVKVDLSQQCVKDSKKTYEFTNVTDLNSTNNFSQTSTKIELSKQNSNSLQLSWKKISKATGYKVYRYTPSTKSYKLIKTITDSNTTKYTDNNLLPATNYYYKLRAYKVVNNKYYYSKYSKIFKATTRPPRPSLKVKSSTKKVLLSWSKTNKKTTGYKVYMSTSKNGTYKLIKTTSNKSYIVNNLSKNKTYYFKVRAYKTVDNKNVYSYYSNIKSVSIK